jgi:hypothetical protein
MKATDLPGIMKIDTKLNAADVTNVTSAKRSTPVATTAADDSSFASSTALAAALKNTPDVRASSVDRARELINDPNYPSADTIKKLAGFLAGQLTSNAE